MANLKPKDFTMFAKSRPWGYKPDDVENTINEYKITITKLNDKIRNQSQTLFAQQNEIERLQTELRRMHMEMSSLELPETDQAVEDMVLSNFAKYNEPHGINDQSEDFDHEDEEIRHGDSVVHVDHHEEGQTNDHRNKGSKGTFTILE